MPRGVPHGIGDGRGRGDHGRLAHSLGAEGAVLRGYLDEHRAYRRHLLAPRHGVIHEGGREELALWIVAHALEKRPAEALGGRALDLPLDGRGLERAPHALHDAVTEPAPVPRA